MKVLYIVPNINNEGGVAKVLALKANYLVDKFGFEVHILTQNGGNCSPFHTFSKNIILHDMDLKGNTVRFLLNYKSQLDDFCRNINPDIIIVGDNGYKAYLIPTILQRTIPIIFECHGSKFIELQGSNNPILNKIKQSAIRLLREFGASNYTRFVALSDESLREWNISNGIVITNPLDYKTQKKAILKSKRVIAVARNSFEKGLDRLLIIWKKVVENNPEWVLDIYGSDVTNSDLKKLASDLKISDSVFFFEPVKNIFDKYMESSIMVMTSRTEGFGMVLIEAMEAGLPIVAYDCPCGPRSILVNNENGFLVEDDNQELFAEKLESLMENENLRIKMGTKASESVTKYDLDTIMQQWKELFLFLKQT